ncbi:hypothetical protein [Leuconostoc holzapfelii]|nr:hypothetical protein [Leuconostoc holzapfelii]
MYEIIILDEVENTERIIYKSKEAFDWALSSFNENGVLIVSSGKVGE